MIIIYCIKDGLHVIVIILILEFAVGICTKSRAEDATLQVNKEDYQRYGSHRCALYRVGHDPGAAAPLRLALHVAPLPILTIYSVFCTKSVFRIDDDLGAIHILGPGKTTSSSIFVLSGSLGPWWSWFPCRLPFVSKNFPLSCQIRQSIDRSKKSFVKFAVNGENSSWAKCSFICVTVSNNHLTHQRSQLPYLLTCPAH